MSRIHVRSFQSTLVLFSILAICLPMLIASLPLAFKLIDLSRENAKETLRVRSEKASRRLAFDIDLIKARMLALASNGDIVDGNKSMLFLTLVDRGLKEFLDQNELVSAVYFSDMEGELRTAAPFGIDYQELVPLQAMIKNFLKQKPHLRQEVSTLVDSEFMKEHRAFLNKLHPERTVEGDEPAALIILTPFKDFWGKLQGVLATVVPFNHFSKALRSELGNESRFQVEMNGQTMLDAPYAKKEFQATQKESYTSKVWPIDGGGGTMMELHVWEPSSLHLQPVDSLLKVTVIFLSLSILLFVLGSIGVARYLLRPIAQISRVVENLSKGQYEVPPMHHSFVEFDKISELLGLMASKIVKNMESERLRIEHENEQKRVGLELELRALRSQMNPHFLFNALNSLVAISTEDPQKTRSMLLELSNLYQKITAATSEKTFPLADELTIVRSYLNLQGMRFGERLQSRIEIEEEAAGIYVPALMLQTFVENALKHGIEKSRKGGCVQITVRKEAEQSFAIRVINTGKEFQAADVPKSSGVGLKNTQQRLQALYGERQSFSIATDSQGATVVTVVLTGEKL